MPLKTYLPRHFNFSWFVPIALCCCLILLSCKQNKNPCNLPASVLADIAKLDSLVKVPALRERDSIWNAGSYKEAPVYSARHETYRFIWSSAFNGSKVYRIERTADSITVTVKKIKKDGDIAETRHFNISESTLTNLTDSLAILGFWTYHHPPYKQVFDPDHWRLEGYKPIPDACTGKRYHSVSGFSPVDSGLYAMCKLFDRLEEPGLK
jgi:hypothetical protein